MKKYLSQPKKKKLLEMNMGTIKKIIGKTSKILVNCDEQKGSQHLRFLYLQKGTYQRLK